MTPLYLHNSCAPGDVTVMSCVARELAKQHPGKYQLHYSGSSRQLLWFNPHVYRIGGPEKPRGVGAVHDLQYGRYLKEWNKPGNPRLHFLNAYLDAFRRQTGIHLELTEPKGDLHLTDEEKAHRPIEEPYWLLFSGGKTDFTVKRWSAARWQQLADALSGEGIRCVQTGASGGNHWNPTLSGVFSLVGQGDLRSLMQQIYHAEGVICGITSAMHIAACFDKPCVVVAGGREPWWFEAYVNAEEPHFGPHASGNVKMPHTYLHTETLLDCCAYGGCWKNKVQRSEPDRGQLYCHKPAVIESREVLPMCTSMITPEHVFEAVMKYRTGLSPIGPKPQVSLPAPQPLAVTGKTFWQPSPPFTQLGKDDVPHVHIPAAAPPQIKTSAGLDHPTIGGKMTICVLLYGDYHELHTKCLNSILSTTPAASRDVRVGCNAVCQRSADYVTRLFDEGQINRVYLSPENLKKYPMMRLMLHDPESPIETKWIVWFDDDSIADRDPSWYTKLGQAIVEGASHGYEMYGNVNWHGLKQSQRALASTRPWYQGRQWQLKNGRQAPNADGVQFICGYFWALSTAAMRKANIPDEILGNNGGDYWIGAQLLQAGVKIKSWNSQRQFVNYSSVPRRGVYELHPGDPGWRPGGVEDVTRTRK